MWIKPETSGESTLIHYSAWSKAEKCELNSFPLWFFHAFSATLYCTFYQTCTLPCPCLMAWMSLSESNKLRNWTGNIYCVVETGWNCELKGLIGHVWRLNRVNWLSLTYFWLSRTHVSRLPVCHKLQKKYKSQCFHIHGCNMYRSWKVDLLLYKSEALVKGFTFFQFITCKCS